MLSVGGDIGSKLEAKDMNMGLLAIVVNGEFDVPGPKRSRFIALDVAVGCGFSSRRFSMLGSKLVSDVQSSGFVGLGDMCEESGVITDDGGEALKMELSGEKCLGTEVAGSGWGLGAMVNVKLACLSMTFSDWSRESRSRRFSFSC